jgi:hypothetical protein
LILLAFDEIGEVFLQYLDDNNEFLTIGASAKPSYCSLPGGSEWLAVVPGLVGAGGAGVALAGDWVLGCGCGCYQKDKT